VIVLNIAVCRDASRRAGSSATAELLVRTCHLRPWVVLIWRQLCTSGFVDDIVFLRNGANGPKSKSTHIFGLVYQTAATMFAWVTRRRYRGRNCYLRLQA